MNEMLQERHELATLLGYPNYRDMVVATESMVESTEQAQAILSDLIKPTKQFAKDEVEHIRAFAKTEGVDNYQDWDKKYYAEKLRAKHHSFASEQLRPYFPVDKVLSGLFQVVETLYGIKISETQKVPKDYKWYKDIRLLTITQKGTLKGRFFLDLYEREHKQNVNETTSIRSRRLNGDNIVVTPIDYFVCNFKPPTKEKPALLTHLNVKTLFHEFGHIAHGLLSSIEYAEVSGRGAVPVDASETHGKFMEYRIWDKTVLGLISEHYQTHKPLPDELITGMVAAKNFMAAQVQLDQYELVWADLEMNDGAGRKAAEAFEAANRHELSTGQQLICNLTLTYQCSCEKLRDSPNLFCGTKSMDLPPVWLPARQKLQETQVLFRHLVQYHDPLGGYTYFEYNCISRRAHP